MSSSKMEIEKLSEMKNGDLQAEPQVTQQDVRQEHPKKYALDYNNTELRQAQADSLNYVIMKEVVAANKERIIQMQKYVERYGIPYQEEEQVPRYLKRVKSEESSLEIHQKKIVIDDKPLAVSSSVKKTEVALPAKKIEHQFACHDVRLKNSSLKMNKISENSPVSLPSNVMNTSVTKAIGQVTTLKVNNTIVTKTIAVVPNRFSKIQKEDWDREIALFKCPNIILEEDWDREIALFAVGKVLLDSSFQKDDDKDISEDWDQEIDLFGASKVLLN